jgi:hypothetical protein
MMRILLIFFGIDVEQLKKAKNISQVQVELKDNRVLIKDLYFFSSLQEASGTRQTPFLLHLSQGFIDSVLESDLLLILSFFKIILHKSSF